METEAVVPCARHLRVRVQATDKVLPMKRRDIVFGDRHHEACERMAEKNYARTSGNEAFMD